MGGLTYRKSPGPDHTFGDNAGAPLRYCVKFLAQILGLSGVLRLVLRNQEKLTILYQKDYSALMPPLRAA